MLIPKPLDIDALIRRVKKGKLITQEQIRRKLAEEFKVEAVCPITTGIFVRIVAEAAEEDLKSGKRKPAPWWRVINRDGSLNPKLPGKASLQAERLKREGHIVFKDSKGRVYVKDFEKSLQLLH
jgi:alkylated DNA nucleotide flippase Atl1